MSKERTKASADERILPVAITTTIPISRSQPAQAGATDDREGRAAAVQCALGSGHGRSAQPPSSRKAAQRRATREPRDHSGHRRRLAGAPRLSTARRRRGCETARGPCAARPSTQAPVGWRARPSRPRLRDNRCRQSNGSSRWIRSRWLCCWRWPHPQTVRATDLNLVLRTDHQLLTYSICCRSSHLRRQERRWHG